MSLTYNMNHKYKMCYNTHYTKGCHRHIGIIVQLNHINHHNTYNIIQHKYIFPSQFNDKNCKKIIDYQNN